MSFVKDNWQKFLALAIWLALIVGFAAYSIITGKAPTDTLRDLVGLMQTPLGPLVYLIIYALRPLTFFSAVVLTVLAGSIWGEVLGVLYTIVAANASASVAYLLGRFLGQGVIDENASTGIIQRYAARMRRNSFETVLIMRLIFIPYDLVSYLAGFLQIGYRPFLLATALGSLPGTITFVLLGASVPIDAVFTGNFTLNPWTFVGAGVVFVLSLALSRYFRRREAQQQTAAGGDVAQPTAEELRP